MDRSADCGEFPFQFPCFINIFSRVPEGLPVKYAYTTDPRDENRREAPGVHVIFCMNCDDIEDLSVSPEADDMDAIRDRFRNCKRSGNFDGDICSRLFVAETGDDPGPLYDDDEIAR